MRIKSLRRLSSIRLLGIVQQRVGKSGANKTETEFNERMLGGRGELHPDPFVITRIKRKKYTADYGTSVDGVRVVIEVKGAYALPSEGRARLAWEIAAEGNQGVCFVWAKAKRGYWDVEAWYKGGSCRRKKACRTPRELNELIKGVLDE